MPASTATLEMKGLGALAIKDADRGEVEAVVATLGVVDRDGDVVLPGAIQSGAVVVMSSYAHDTVKGRSLPVGKGQIVVEGDRAIFRGRIFLATERGRETFAVLKEMGGDQEWSFGFAILEDRPPTEEWRVRGARRLLTRLGAFEVSPVIIAAGVGTGTLHLKAADGSLTGRIEAVQNALWARNERAAQPWYAVEVFDGYVIVRSGAMLLRVDYTLDGEGVVTLGDAVEVEIEYRPVQASEEKTAGGPPEVKALDAEEDGALRAAQAAAADEFDRFQRTLRRLGVS